MTFRYTDIEVLALNATLGYQREIQALFERLEWSFSVCSRELQRATGRNVGYATVSELEYAAGQLLGNAVDTALLSSLHRAEPVEVGYVLAFNQDSFQFVADDHGEGVHPYMEPLLFQPIVHQQLPPQVSKIYRRAPVNLCGALGLGLTHVRDRIATRQGEVGFFNKGHDRGAVFWYTMPLHGFFH